MATAKRVLILGGTSDAIALAAKAAELPGVDVITSLAGRTRQPGLHDGTRIGGFGGIIGLTNYLQEHHIDRLIDATHPFAAQISFNAVAAATAAGIPHLMLIRPAWVPLEGDRWLTVDNYEAAATLLPELAQRIWLTIGRQDLAAFAHLQDLWFLIRMIDPPSPDSPVPPGVILLEREPFAVEEKRSLLHRYRIEVIISKNSGGAATYAKIIAARELGIPVVMVQRPPVPDGNQVADVKSALVWIMSGS